MFLHFFSVKHACIHVVSKNNIPIKVVMGQTDQDPVRSGLFRSFAPPFFDSKCIGKYSNPMEHMG